MKGEIDYGKVNPPIWDCVAFQDFRLVPEHLERLLEIRRLREEIDPDMRYSVSFTDDGEIARDENGKPKRGSRAVEKELRPTCIAAYAIRPKAPSKGVMVVLCSQPMSPPCTRMESNLDPNQLRQCRKRWSSGSSLEY